MRTDAVAVVARREGYFVAALMAALAAAYMLAAATPARAQVDFGTWLTDDRKAKVTLRECGESKLCSEIVWLKDPVDEKGEPWRDGLNPDPSMRRRTVVGIDILKNLKKTAENTWTGEIYDPEEGKYYYLKRIAIGSEKVEIRGCLSSGWPCRSKYWTRTTPVQPPAPPMQIAKKPRPAVTKPVQQAAVAPVPVAPAPATLAPATITRAPVQMRRPEPQQQAALTPPPPAPKPVPAPRTTTPAQQQSSARGGLPWQNQVVSRAAAAPTTTGSLSGSATPAGGSNYLVQVTAGQNQNEALRTFGKLQRRYPQLLGGYLPNIQRVDLGDKGVWYRVRIGPMEQHTVAADFCERLKAAGGDCLIRRE